MLAETAFSGKIKKSNTGKSTLYVNGDLVIKNSIAFKELLSKAIKGSTDIILLLEEVTNIDVTSIQLIRAFVKDMKKKGLNVVIVPPQKSSVIISLKQTGFYNLILSNNA